MLKGQSTQKIRDEYEFSDVLRNSSGLQMTRTYVRFHTDNLPFQRFLIFCSICGYPNRLSWLFDVEMTLHPKDNRTAYAILARNCRSCESEASQSERRAQSRGLGMQLSETISPTMN